MIATYTQESSQLLSSAVLDKGQWNSRESWIWVSCENTGTPNSRLLVLIALLLQIQDWKFWTDYIVEYKSVQNKDIVLVMIPAD